MAAPLVPILLAVAGTGVAAAVTLRVRKSLNDAKNGNVPATPESISQLPPAVQAKLNTGGAPPTQAAINALLQMNAAGTLDPATIVKASNGAIGGTEPIESGFKIPDDQLALIDDTFTLNVDVNVAGIQTPAVPSGAIMMQSKSKSDMTTRTIKAASIDPRLPNDAVVTIPLSSIAGLG